MFRKANIDDAVRVNEIFDNAKEKFKLDKTFQWQGEYPNKSNFLNDFNKGYAYVIEDNSKVIGCITIMPTIDYNYLNIDGKWLNDEEYACIHRIAISKDYYHRGVGTRLLQNAETICKENNIKNIRIDTHKNNKDMRNLLIRNGYIYCGVIILNNRPDLVEKGLDVTRVAYQKVIK